MGEHATELSDGQKKANKKKANRGTALAVVVFAALAILAFFVGPLFGAAFGSLVLALGGIWAVRNRAFEQGGAEVSDSEFDNPLALAGVGGAMMLGAAIAAVALAVDNPPNPDSPEFGMVVIRLILGKS